VTDAERIGDLETQVQNYETERAWLVARIAVLEQANQVLTRQLLDKRGFASVVVDGRIVVMGRN
jgi:hypothetical protein